MTLAIVLSGLAGVAGLVAIVRRKRNARSNRGPIQLGVGTKIRP